MFLGCHLYVYDMCCHISNKQQTYLFHTLKHTFNIPPRDMFLVFFSPKFQTTYYILNIPNTYPPKYVLDMHYIPYPDSLN